MENPTRSAQHQARVEQRRADLRERFAAIFPSPASIIWEVGCGHGHFLTAYAKIRPDQLCVGIDITADRIERANRKRARANLANLHFIQAEARTFLETLPPYITFSNIYILFPDPWPKLRHHKNRIMRSDFLGAVARRAGEQSRLYFRTDYQPYFDDVRETLRNHPDWLLFEEPWAFEHETVFQSRAPHFSSLVARPRSDVLSINSSPKSHGGQLSTGAKGD